MKETKFVIPILILLIAPVLPTCGGSDPRDLIDCEPECAGRCCGDDGCGGICPNQCSDRGQTCNVDTCECEGDCQDQTCDELAIQCGTWMGVCGTLLDCGVCSGFNYCDESVGQCFPGCEDDGQCSEVGVCNEYTHECECPEDYHSCGSDCAWNYSPESCGDRCSPCPTDPNGRATCNGYSCGIECDEDYVLEAGACRPIPMHLCNSFVDFGSSVSLILDSEESPHISYYDGTNRNLKYAQIIDSEWDIQIVDSIGDVGGISSIATDSGDLPHISYQDASNGGLKYARFTGKEWDIEMLTTEELTGRYISLLLDSSDYPHISYGVSSYTRLEYARFLGTVWEFQSPAWLYVRATEASFALDSRDFPIFIYSYLGEGFESGLAVAQWTGSEWESDLVREFDERQISLALDSADNPHFISGSEELDYIYRTGAAWRFETVGSEESASLYSSLAIDSFDNIHVSYSELAHDTLKYARLIGSGWDIRTLDTGEDRVSETALALNSRNRPHIVYVDSVHGRVKYLWFSSDESCSL